MLIISFPIPKFPLTLNISKSFLCSLNGDLLIHNACTSYVESKLSHKLSFFQAIVSPTTSSPANTISILDLKNLPCSQTNCHSATECTFISLFTRTKQWLRLASHKHRKKNNEKMSAIQHKGRNVYWPSHHRGCINLWCPQIHITYGQILGT
jgi:hypothetical protein